MLVDVAIVILAAIAIYRGWKSGFIRQFCATVGFFGGLYLGGLLLPHTINFAQASEDRATITVVTVLSCALISLTIGEYFGLHLKRRLLAKQINHLDNGFGSVLGVVSVLLSIWLLAAVSSGLPSGSFISSIRSSYIIASLNRVLPPAPSIIAGLGHLVDPNGFPDVFIGTEPIPRGNINLPALGDLAEAVNQDKDSVVRIKGQGCGGVVAGSGFVVADDLVATNAHVVAGIRKPYVQDASGRHAASVISFDPELDFAVLRVSDLAGSALEIATGNVSAGTPAAVLGYPGGGDFKADPAAVLSRLTASGRDIYGRGHTLRDVYEVRADIVPGNSGGPLVAKDGSVIGVVFAESTSFNHVGYALTNARLNVKITQAAASTQAVGTGRCAE